MTETAVQNDHRPKSTVIYDLAKQGLTFSPTSPGMTRSDHTDWQNLATSDWPTIRGWVIEGSSLVSVAKQGHGFAIDIDDVAAVAAKGFDLAWLDGYFVVDTPSGGLHAHGRHDADSDKIGASLVLVYAEKGNKDSDKILELKLNNGSVAAPTAWRINQPGKVDGVYAPRNEVKEIRPGLCKELMEWLAEHAEAQTKTVAGRKNWDFHEDHNQDDLLANYHCVESRHYWTDSTLWVVPDKCPNPDCASTDTRGTDLATKTKFSFGGRGWGFVCHYCGINSRAELEDKLKESYCDFKSWRKKVYAKRDDDDNAYGWELEAANDEPVNKHIAELSTRVPDMQVRDPIAEMSEATKQELSDNSKRGQAYATEAAKAEAHRKAFTQELETEAQKEEEKDEEHSREGKVVRLGVLTLDDFTTTLMTRRASDIEMTELKWFWPQKIPQGKATLFTGKPDCGKSMCLLDLCACATTGRNFPDGALNTMGAVEVLIAATEDDPADTIIPRLKAAGADLTKVHIVKGILREKQGKRLSQKSERLSLKRDVKLLLEAIRANPNIKLLALDPISGFFGDADSNKDSDVRPMLEDLQKMLNVSGVTLVGIIHSNKRSDVDAIGAVSGATAIAAIVRATWGFSRDREDKSLYHMSFVKGNLGKVKTGLDYTVEETFVEIEGKPVGVPRIKWGDANESDANDFLDKAREHKEEKDTKVAEATTFIRTMMPAKSKDIYKKGEDIGLSVATIKRARYKMQDVLSKRFQDEWWMCTADNLPWWTKNENTALDDIPE